MTFGHGAIIVAITLFVVAPTAARRRRTPAQDQPRNASIVELEKRIAGHEQEPAEQVFKNVQTFKGMPAIRLLRIMELAFVPNLGVECTHCHVEGKWELDDKPEKQIARGMWTLRSDVQAQVRKLTGNQDAAVTCYTCHKGQPKPAFAPGR